MDLLDLELDLNVEGASTPGRVTRRSQVTAPTHVTPKTPSKTDKPPAVTPKSNVSAKKIASATKTPTKARSQASPKTPAKTPGKASMKTPAKTPKKTPAKTPKKTPAKSLTIVEVTPQTPEEESISMESTSHEERQSRSESVEKRSRNKAKKRFSPSPVAKKRKSIATTPTVSAAPKTNRIASLAEFKKELRIFEIKLKQSKPVDFVIPDGYMEDDSDSSEAAEQDINLTGNSNNNGDGTSAATPSAQTPNASSKTSRKSLPPKRVRASTVHSRMPDAVSSTSTTSSDGIASDVRCRTFSREIGVEDDTEPVPPPKRLRVRSASVRTLKEATETATGRRSGRKLEFSEAKIKKEIEEPWEQSVASEVVKKDKEVSVTTKPRRKSTAATPKKSGLQLETGDEPSTSSALTSTEAQETPKTQANPNSALAIKLRLMGDSKASPKSKTAERKLMKEEAVPAPTVAPEFVQDTPEIQSESAGKTSRKEEQSVPTTPLAAPPTPSASSVKKTSPSVIPPTRASARVSKPNRLYTDESFNTEILGRTRVSEQNPVKQAQAKEATPEISEVPLPVQFRRRSMVPRPPPTPKPIPVINGVQRGYIPSVKVPLEDYEVDGVVVKLNEEVTETMNILLFKVCEDGIEMHEDIDPKVVKAKNKAKLDEAKRLKLEARKLDLQMKIKIPTTTASEELGKRKRQAPKTDDFFYSPLTNRSKLKESTIEEDREVTPYEDHDSSPADERRHQKARDSISRIIDAEMDATMKEAKKYSVSFDKYIRPKIIGAQKHANVRLMSRKRQSAEPDDFYYHELLVDQVSPSNSNVENVGDNEEMEELDIMGIDKEDSEEEIPQEGAVIIRKEALDMAEQIAILLPRPTKHDGSPMSMDLIQMRAMEHIESRRVCLADTIQVVLNQIGYEAAPPTRGAEEQGCMWHTVTSANAQALKNVYTISNTLKEDAITWTHQFIVENMPVHMLAAYLSLFRYARRINPARFGYIISSTDQIDSEWTQATSLLKSFAYKRGPEPGTEILGNTIPYHRMSDTVFLLVSPTLTFGDHQRPRHHGRIFRWLQSIGHLDSETINFSEDIDASCSVAEYLSDVVVEKICDKVRQKNKERPQCRVVLVGYGASTYLIHRAANLVEGISAIISIGFPVMTPLGRRGTADDEILLTYCPTLFIVGSEGQRFNNEAMCELRSSMLAPTGLVVVGHSSDLLLVPTSMLLRLGISQTVIFRMVLEKILDFLNLEAVRQQVFSDLVPMELNNVYDLDSSLLKSDKALSGLAFANTPSATSSAAPSPVGSAGRRATVTGASGDDVPKKKRELVQHSHSSMSSSLGGPPIPSPRADERFLAFQSLVTSTVATADDMPRRASIGSSPRVVERGDFRDHRPAVSRLPMPSSSLPQPSPRGPVDPASISLS